MRAVFRPEARVEVFEAQDWYESRSLGLGLEFARSLEAAISAAMRNPSAFPVASDGCRQALLRKFPYSLIYRVSGDELLVIAVFHHRRNPAKLPQRTGR